MSTVIKVENLSKQYRLGKVGSGTIRDDFSRFLARIQGKEDPTLKIGQTNILNGAGSNDEGPDSQYVWALKDINFEVKQGEVLGIIGKNGAGKSTLLKILSKVTTPTTGSVKVNGRIASLLEVGTGFHPELSGRENIFLNGAILGMTKTEIRSKFDEIVDFSGVERYIDTPVKRYSSGMYVRLAFAVAAHLEPEILVVDEVLAVGDADFQKKAIGKMQNLSKGEGRTVLFVSHNMTSLQNLCFRGIILKNGIKTFDNNIDAAITTYLSQSQDLMDKFLGERTDRAGNGLVRFTDVKFIDDDYNLITPTLRSGQNLKIEISYSTTLPVGNKINIGLGFLTQQGAFLFGCRNDVNGDTLIINEEKKAICKINSFPLNKGSYKYNLIAYYRGEIVDHVVDAGTIDVEGGDFYGTGQIPAAGKPGVLINFKWE